METQTSKYILVAVALGLLFGGLFPGGDLLFLADLGKLIIHWVKLIAGPFLFLTIVASVVEVHISPKHGLRVVLIALLNTSIAIAIGMGLAATFLGDVQLNGLNQNLVGVKSPEMQLSWAAWVKTLMPASLFSPFVQNEILLIALLALLTGLALRKLNLHKGEGHLNVIAKKCEEWRALPGVFLHWLIALIPFAVFTVVAGAVSEHGYGIFLTLFKYVGVVILGFCLQVILVYGSWLFLVARLSPGRFWAETHHAILYAFGVNSSLATLPFTLSALKKLGVSSRSASLGAGVATNLNNDGIVLYEAMAVYFVAQLHHIQLDPAQMFAAALACIVASMGITGIPEAGFISLSVVVTTLGLPLESLPLLLAVDWILARLRSVVNVISDITLSVALDATEPKR